MDQPRLIVTGSSGFVGRHLIEALRDRARIHAIARRSLRSGQAFTLDGALRRHPDAGRRRTHAAAPRLGAPAAPGSPPAPEVFELHEAEQKRRARRVKPA
jgi:nucleoside-diphosphate-sugar epimerase